ncbi:hypothetical protein CAter282_3574 [Collimonas arenae]|uniref:Uncharacterized protein n=1 Tax=Collimonas arenae TaxID=279058 RepID=A0A127QMI0_9BURK|nr:hypothetical protein CAter10_3911 [Collimonas arenae]AMP11260.1 hypothetical protein CAter282_3574 [Collimonas arenae]
MLRSCIFHADIARKACYARKMHHSNAANRADAASAIVFSSIFNAI